MKIHEEDCKNHNAVNIYLPLKGRDSVKFTNYNNSLRVPFVIHADFECLLEKREEDLYRIAEGLGIDPIGKERVDLVKKYWMYLVCHMRWKKTNHTQ